MNIRHMEMEDLDRVTEMETICFKDPWSRDNLRYELEENPFSTGWIVEEDGVMAGYAFVWEIFEKGELANICIAPAFRKRGLARKLLTFAEEQASQHGCETMMLEVRVGNHPARRLYETAGYIEVNRVKGYYSDGEDAIIECKPL